MDEKPLVSIIITSYALDTFKDISELLDSIKAQTYINTETVFVAERSQELFEKVKTYAVENAIPNVNVVFNNGELGLSAARNLGIKLAKGDIIGFVDADAVLFPDWVEGVVKVYKDNNVIGITGPSFPLWEGKPIDWLPEELYWLISCTGWTGWKETRRVRSAFGTNMAFSRKAFSDGFLFSQETGYVRGQHHQPVADDLEFSLRLRRKTGESFIFSPDVRVWHRASERRLNLRFVAARAHQIGCTRRILSKYYASELGAPEQEQRVIKGILRLWLGLPKGFFNRPRASWKRLLLTVVLVVSIVTGRLIPTFGLKVPDYLTRQN